MSWNILIELMRCTHQLKVGCHQCNLLGGCYDLQNYHQQRSTRPREKLILGKEKIKKESYWISV